MVFLILVGALSGGKTSNASTSSSAPAPAGLSYTQTAPAAPAAPAKPAGPATSFGDGTWVVGQDVAPGTYRSDGAKAGLFDLCSVSTHTGDAGDGSIVDWKTGNAGEPVRIRVSGAVKSVESHGCNTFTEVA